MIEIVPNAVDSVLLYFHTRQSTGDEIAPFLDELRAELPNTYIWAGDGNIYYQRSQSRIFEGLEVERQ
jgi:hypothetical protein